MPLVTREVERILARRMRTKAKKRASESIRSRQIDDLEPRLTRRGYDTSTMAEQFDAKPAEIRKLLRGDLDPVLSQKLADEMRTAGLPLRIRRLRFSASADQQCSLVTTILHLLR